MTDRIGALRTSPIDQAALIERLRALDADDDQRKLVPLREAVAWAQPQPIVSGPGTAPTIDSARAAGADVRASALLSADVYRDTASPPPEYRVARAEDLDRLGIRTQDLSSPVSAFRARVYIHHETGDAVVAFRGSQTGDDWRANIRQGAGLPTDHYARALRIGAALARHPDARVTLTGHSLGGGLASAAAAASGRDAITFNAAGLSPPTLAQADSIRRTAAVKQAAQVAAFHVRGEILTAIQEGGDRLIGAIIAGPAGAAFFDAPPAIGERRVIEPVTPPGGRETIFARHGIEFVLYSLGVGPGQARAPR